MHLTSSEALHNLRSAGHFFSHVIYIHPMPLQEGDSSHPRAMMSSMRNLYKS